MNEAVIEQYLHYEKILAITQIPYKLQKLCKQNCFQYTNIFVGLDVVITIPDVQEES